MESSEYPLIFDNTNQTKYYCYKISENFIVFELILVTQSPINEFLADQVIEDLFIAIMFELTDTE